MSQREQAALALERISDEDMGIVLNILLHYAAIDPDDILTPEDLKDIRKAEEEFARGEYVAHEDIDW